MANYLREKKKRANMARFAREGEMHALVYCRVSSDRQASEGHGLDSQERRCRDFVNRKGYASTEVFRDAASGGGGYQSRPGQMEIMERVLGNPHRKYVVIVDDTSRLARDIQGHFEIRELLRECQVSIESPNFTFGETPEDEVVEGIMASVNQYHRKGNRRQVVQKMKARIENGYWPFGGKKGYTMTKHPAHGKLAVPNEEGLTMLKPAMEMFAAGMLVRKVDVCRFLVEKGFWKKQSPEKYIDKLTQILKDPFYCGDLHYPAWEVSRRNGQQEGIVSREVFEKVQTRLHKDGAGARIRTDITPEFPLRGLLICTKCKRHLTGALSTGHSRKYPYYYCQYKACELYSKMFRREDAETAFKALLEHNTLKPEVGTLTGLVFDRVWEQEMGNVRQQERTAEGKAKELRERIRELSDLARKAAANSADTLQRVYESQMEDSALELERLEHLLGGERDLEVPYRTALGKAIGMLENPITIWDTVDTTEKHRLFFFLFETKLEYSKIDGYRTADSLSNTRLFREFATANPLDVEVGRVELPSESVM